MDCQADRSDLTIAFRITTLTLVLSQSGWIQDHVGSAAATTGAVGAGVAGGANLAPTNSGGC